MQRKNEFSSCSAQLRMLCWARRECVFFLFRRESLEGGALHCGERRKNPFSWHHNPPQVGWASLQPILPILSMQSLPIGLLGTHYWMHLVWVITPSSIQLLVLHFCWVLSSLAGEKNCLTTCHEKERRERSQTWLQEEADTEVNCNRGGCSTTHWSHDWTSSPAHSPKQLPLPCLACSWVG